tara:strand:+ start:679 stop:951 length:273 start_codon:yes stop_codon:yes gene_type:complete
MCKLATLNGECQSLSDSPCIGWCTSRQFGDDRCKGCGRLESEIKQWNEYTILEKKLINIRNAGDGYSIRQVVPTGWRPNINNITPATKNK